jgi:hypothetical protein
MNPIQELSFPTSHKTINNFPDLQVICQTIDTIKTIETMEKFTEEEGNVDVIIKHLKGK